MKTPKIIRNIFTLFIIALVFVIIVSISPITGSYKIFVVKSGSMEPVIKTGSIVVVKPEESYKIGDIVTFKSEKTGDKNSSITHRIINTETQITVKTNEEGVRELIKGEEKFITKGDANNAEDESRLRKDMIIGKVLFSIPYFGYAVAEARKPIGFIVLVIIPSAIIIFDETRKIAKEIKRMNMKKKKKV